MTLPDDIYSQRILELAAAMPRTARLAMPEATATAHSKLCGSTVTVDLAMEGDVVTDYGQKVKACLLGQSAASVMGREIVGSTAAELRAVGAAMRKMLKEGGPPPDGKWSDLAVLEPVRDYKARHASTLLVFDAVEDAIAQIEARRAAAARLASTCLRCVARAESGRVGARIAKAVLLAPIAVYRSRSRRCWGSIAGICRAAPIMRARPSTRTARGRAAGSRWRGSAAAIPGAATASIRCPTSAASTTRSRRGATEAGSGPGDSGMKSG